MLASLVFMLEVGWLGARGSAAHCTNLQKWKLGQVKSVARTVLALILQVSMQCIPLQGWHASHLICSLLCRPATSLI